MQRQVPICDRPRSGRLTRRLASASASTLLLLGLGCGEDAQAPTSPDASAKPDLDVTAASTYTIRDLGTLGGTSSEATAINAAGTIVGWSTVTAGDFRHHGFIWKTGVMRDLGTLAGGESEALAVNDSGVVVGWSRVLSGAMRAVRWKDGVKKNLGTLGGRNSQATGINVSGVIVGWSETASGERHPFIWKDGVMTDLGTLGGTFAEARGINRAGKVVGASTVSADNLKSHAFTWKDGVFKDLGTNGRTCSFATAINTKGQIVGGLCWFPDAEGEERDWGSPFLFYQDVWTVFGTRQPSSQARAISSEGVIVGSDEDPRNDEATEDAWVRENGTVQRLPELAVGHSRALGVNRNGTIVGFGQTAAGDFHAVLWRRQ